MRKILSFSFAFAITVSFVGMPLASAQHHMSGDGTSTIAEKRADQLKAKVKNTVEVVNRSQRVKNKTIEKCVEAGNTEESCEDRLKDARKDLAKKKRQARRGFVMMIVNAKKECKAASEDKAEVRECFRAKVKEGVKKRVLAARGNKKDCREELGDDALPQEILACATEKQVADDEDEDEDSSNS